MIMSIQDPLTRKRRYTEGLGEPASKRAKDEPEDGNKLAFNEKMYSIYVKNALQSLENGDSTQIDTLVAKIRFPASHNESVDRSNFCIVLKILMSNISKLDNSSCNQLIMTILEYQWLDVDHRPFHELYSQFLLILVSSYPKYLHKVTDKLVGEFAKIVASQAVSHHKLLKHILKYTPTFINSLPAILHKNLPHYLSSEPAALTNYVSNLLEILSYCRELQFDVWSLVIECSIKLDVELQNDLDDLDDDEIEELINGNDEIDSDDSDNDDEDDEQDLEDVENEDSDEEAAVGTVEYYNPMTTTKNIKELVHKLDTILSQLMASASPSFQSTDLDDGNGVYLFNTITSLFKTHILSTHFTKSTQFILFHIAQQQLELSDSFLVLLIDIAFNNSEILEKRLKAMQYLSSFIARAKNLSRHQLVFVVSYLIGWLSKYVDERECEIHNDTVDGKEHGGMERFKLFYAAFQALLYIFCFRYKILNKEEDSGNDGVWECDLDKFFQRVIITKFNPLKFVDETVCFIFAKIATKLNVCYCYSIIEHNKRERMSTIGNMPSSVGNFKQKQEFLDLEAYFPFDPLVLPECKKVIAPLYVEWTDVNPEDEDDEEESASGASPQGDSSESESEDEDN